MVSAIEGICIDMAILQLASAHSAHAACHASGGLLIGLSDLLERLCIREGEHPVWIASATLNSRKTAETT